MPSKEHFEKHASLLGSLLGNLQMIETAARFAIAKLDAKESERIYTQLPQIKAGDIVEWNIHTNSDDLRKILNKFNKRVPVELKVNVSQIVSLRDALAHGRAFGYGDMECLRLLKFSRKQIKGKVTVELAEDMSENWFMKNIADLEKTSEKIRLALDYERKNLE